MKRILYPILFIVTFTLCADAQVTFQPKSVDIDWKGVVYKTEQTMDIRVHANGWALAYNTGNIVSYEKTRYYQFELGKHSDPREKLQSKPYNLSIVGNSNSFAFGKINNFYSLRAGTGRKKYLSEKARRKGIAVAYNYEFGPALGILKPYYLDIYVANETGGFDITQIKYSEETAAQFLDNAYISSEAKFSEGLFESKIVPGLQGKVGVHFDAGAYDEFVKAVEIGAMLEVYTQSIPFMAPTENHSNSPFFLNLYVNLQFGKRK